MSAGTVLNFAGREHWKESKGQESSLPGSHVSLLAAFSMWGNQLLEVASSTRHFLESCFPMSHHHFGQGVWEFWKFWKSAQHLSRLLCHPMGHAFKGWGRAGVRGITLLDLLLFWMPCLSSGVVAALSEIPILFRIDFCSYQVTPCTVHPYIKLALFKLLCSLFPVWTLWI